MKRIISLILSLVLLLTCFAGCSKETYTGTLFNEETVKKLGDTGGIELPLTNEDVTVTWQVVSSENNLNESWFIKKLEEVTGINIELIVMPSSTKVEKLNAMIAGGDLPDVIGSMTTQQAANDLAMQGAFATVEDYIDKLPNFKRQYVDNKENSWIFDAYAAPDGKLYGYYGYDWMRDINHTFMYRKDIFDKHGIKMWTNNDEFYQVLKKLKELYPDSYPYTSKVGDQIFQKWSTGWGVGAHFTYYDEQEKVWKFTDTDLKYKDMLDFIKKLYDEKLIDPEFLTLTQSAWTQRMTTNKSFVTFDWIDRMTMFKEQTADTIPDYDLRFANPVGPNMTYSEVSQICGPKFVRKQDPKREEIIFKLLDFVASPAGRELMTMGIEGETYTIGEDGMAKYIEFTDKVPSMSDLEIKYGMFLEGMYLSFDRRSIYFNFPPQLQEAQDFVQNPENLEPMDPIVSFTLEENEKVNDILATLQKAGKEFAVKYVLGNASWDDWVKKAKSLKCDELVKIYNDAQKRLDAK